MNEIYAIALSWAVTLSGYPTPPQGPQVVMVPHNFLVAQACRGKECRVLGWFPPGDKIYLDERLDPRDDLYASSILVHEMVHYLQHQARNSLQPLSCEQTMALEREAYRVQSEYLIRYGTYRPVGVSMNSVNCTLAHQD